LGNTVRGVELKTSEDVARVLLEDYKVAVVPSTAFGYENYIRISFATSMRDIVEGSNRIEKFVKDNF
jgi:aspartate aminotransferase